MKRLATFFFLALAYLAVALPPASAQFNGCPPGFCSPPAAGPVVPSCTEATAFLARTSGLDTPHQNNYKYLICGLVTDGVWSKFDILYTFATQDVTTANLNLVSSSFTNTAAGTTITWTADRGWAGTETPSNTRMSYGTGVLPTPNFTTNNAHGSLWINSSGQSAGVGNGAGGNGQGAIDIYVRTTSDQTQYYMNTPSGTNVTVTNTNALGFYVANMNAGVTLTGWKNGVIAGTLTTTAVASWGGNLFLGAANAYPGSIVLSTGHQISAASWGGSLTATDELNLYNRMRTYMTAVGIP